MVEDKVEEVEKSASPELVIPEQMAILPIRGGVVFPRTVVPLTVGQPRSMKLVDDAVVGKTMIGLVTSKNPQLEEPGPEELYRCGTVAIVHRLFKTPDGTLRLAVEGIERIRVTEFVSTEPYLSARVELARETVSNSVELQALMRSVADQFRQLVQLMPHMPEELSVAAINIEDPRQLVYLVATNVRMELTLAQQLLELDDVGDKLRMLSKHLTKELEVLELGKKIQTEAQGQMEKVQREYFLREQVKAIQKELGETDAQQAEIEELSTKIAQAGMPAEAEKEARRELDRLSKMPSQAAEYSVIKTYLDWLTVMPWQKGTPDNLDIKRAREILDEDHYDLEGVKKRILEYLAVRKLRMERGVDGDGSQVKGAILCFVGPPGTGKTSLGRSIAHALGREFIRMSLGGMHDEAEVRGHRRTYIGALPGRIIQGIRRAGTNNPVFMLDEIDKVGADYRGDPTSALLEVLDPEQNCTFRDNYLDVPFDLSKVMFITTGNLLEPIPAPLLDRMEVLRLDGYTEEEKVKIARQYILPRQIRDAGLKPSEIRMSDSAVRKVIADYTFEAGLRNLEREVGSIARKVATKIAETPGLRVSVGQDQVSEYLGKPRFHRDAVERTSVPGVATGLVVTAVGGDITFIEVTKMKGAPGMLVTGQLGDVMRESAQAAMSYVRSKAVELGIDPDVFDCNQFHIHLPAGAIPKDGPSAGVTMATALLSLLRGKPIRRGLAMTGEITLRGKVLPVGGIKQKVLAAARAGMKMVVLPRRNEADLDDVPEEARRKLEFRFADTVEDVFEAALSTERRRRVQEPPAVSSPPASEE
jgi:ATP-dependent Lon protease